MPLRVALLAGVLTTVFALSVPTPAAENQPPAGTEPVLRVYNIEELILPVPDSPGPIVDVEFAGAGSLPVFGGAVSASHPDEAAIVEMIKHRIAPASWRASNASIEPRNGQLVVVQLPEVHRQVEDLLRSIRDDVRRRLLIRGILVAVDDKTAADFRMRKDRVLDVRAVEELIGAAGKNGLLASQQVVCNNGQRNHAWSGRWSTYILIQEIHDVRDLLFQVQNFPGLTFGGAWGGSSGGGGGVILAVPPTTGTSSAALVSAVRLNVEPASWDRAGVSIAEHAGRLIVVQTPACHRKIRQYLGSLSADCLPAVAVQCLAVAVSDEVADRLRARKSMECTVEETGALIKEAGEGGLLAAPEILCYDRQRVSCSVGQQRTYICGLMEMERFRVPSVTTESRGCYLDVRPVLSPDRRAATVELRLDLLGDSQHREETVLAEVAPARDQPAVASKVTLASGKVIRVRDAVSMPVGRYVLAGAFRRSGPEAKAAPNVLVLVKVEVVGFRRTEQGEGCS